MKNQAPSRLDDELSQLQCTKPAVLFKIAQLPQNMWMTLPSEAKMWLLNEEKRKQIEEEKAKKPVSVSDTNAVELYEKDQKYINMPNQYAKVKNKAEGKEMIQEGDQISPMALLMNFFKKHLEVLA